MSDTARTFEQKTPSEIERELDHLNRLARTLDSRFVLPGTSIRFGLDTLIGLVPGIGDTLVAAPSAWIIWRGHRMGIGKRHIARMVANSAADYVIGLNHRFASGDTTSCSVPRPASRYVGQSPDPNNFAIFSPLFSPVPHLLFLPPPTDGRG